MIAAPRRPRRWSWAVVRAAGIGAIAVALLALVAWPVREFPAAPSLDDFDFDVNTDDLRPLWDADRIAAWWRGIRWGRLLTDACAAPPHSRAPSRLIGTPDTDRGWRWSRFGGKAYYR